MLTILCFSSLLSYALAAINQHPIVVYWEKERDEDKEIVTSLERAFDVCTNCPVYNYVVRVTNSVKIKCSGTETIM